MHVSAADLGRYPLDQPESVGYQQLKARCAEGFSTDGVALLPGFLTDAGVRAIATEARGLADFAFFSRSSHDVFLDVADADSADNQQRQVRTDVGSIANDYLDPAGALQQLYNSDWLAAFVADVVGYNTLFPSADPLGALSINVFAPGDGHGWHFDESLFTVTLMVQEADEGGHFEYVNGLRSETRSDDAAIESVLAGATDRVQRLPFQPGTLSIFRGRHTMHRVTAVGGENYRFVPVLTYATEPGYRNSDEVRQLFWGRSERDAAR